MTMKEVGAVAFSVIVFVVWSAALIVVAPMAFEAVQLPSPVPFSIAEAIPFLVAGSLFFTGWIAFTRWWGRTSGWRQLANRYPAVEPRTGERIVVRYPYFRQRYSSVLLRAGESHLHFQLHAPYGLPPFSVAIGHVPFSVPWADIAAQPVPHWLGERVGFTFAREPEVPFKVRPADAKRIIDASRGRVRLSDESTAAGVRAHA